MTTFTFKTKSVKSGNTVVIPDNARDIDINYDHGPKGTARVSYFEKQGDSIQ